MSTTTIVDIAFFACNSSFGQIIAMISLALIIALHAPTLPLTRSFSLKEPEFERTEGPYLDTNCWDPHYKDSRTPEGLAAFRFKKPA